MAWPASRRTLAQAFKQGDDSMVHLKNHLTTLSARSEVEDIPRKKILQAKNYLEDLDDLMSNTIGYGAVAVAYAQSEYRDVTLDVAAEYMAVRDAARAFALWIGSQLPDGIDLTEYSSTVGGQVDLYFTSAQLAAFRTNTTTFIATIS